MTRNSNRPTGPDHSTPDEAAGIDRRDVLQLAGGAGVGTLLPTGLLGGALAGPAQAAMPDVVQASLKVQMATVDSELMLRTYNGQTPGPTLRVQAGGQLQVLLENALDPNPAGDPGNCLDGEHMNEFHGRNTTNLHTHGLHISPTRSEEGFDSDNIFLEVLPELEIVECAKDTFRKSVVPYVFDIVPHHPPGTHWYHAHKHGSTAQQVANGLAGPLIVDDPTEGPLVMPPYIAQAKERIFMIQSRNLKSDEPDGGKGELKIVLTNEDGQGGGDKDPDITLNPGAVERWRIINASPSSEAFLKLSLDTDQIELWQIAFDGLTLNQRWKIKQDDDKDPWENAAALAPGNRMDLMIHVPTSVPEGSYRMSVTPHTDSVMQDGTFLASDPVDLKIKIAGPTILAEWSNSDELPGSGLDEITETDLEDDETHQKRTTAAVFYLNSNAGGGDDRQRALRRKCQEDDAPRQGGGMDRQQQEYLHPSLPHPRQSLLRNAHPRQRTGIG